MPATRRKARRQLERAPAERASLEARQQHPLRVMTLLPRHEIASARSEMEAAEQALDTALGLIDVASRADKVAITSAVEQALERLRSARTKLALLEEAIERGS